MTFNPSRENPHVEYPFRKGGNIVRVLLGLGFALLVAAGAFAQTIHGREGIVLPSSPAVEASPVADNYFGTRISDSYRWLEDAKSTETRAFLDAQNAYTARYLKQARIRPDVVDDLDALENVTRVGVPIERADSYFFSKRLAGEQQASLYVRHGWTGKGRAPDRPGPTEPRPQHLGRFGRCVAGTACWWPTGCARAERMRPASACST